MSPAGCKEFREEIAEDIDAVEQRNKEACAETAALVGNMWPLLQRLDEKTSRIATLENKIDDLSGRVSRLEGRFDTVEKTIDRIS